MTFKALSTRFGKVWNKLQRLHKCKRKVHKFRNKTKRKRNKPQHKCKRNKPQRKFFLVPIFTYSEGPGILRRLWIAVNGTVTNGRAVPGNVFLRIYVDGTICVGNYAIDTQGIG